MWEKKNIIFKKLVLVLKWNKKLNWWFVNLLEHLHFWIQWQSVLSDNTFTKCSQAHVAIFITAAWRFLMQYHLRPWRPSTFNSGFRPWTMHWDFPRRLKIWFLKICSVNSENLCWDIFFFLLTILSWCSALSGEPRHIFTCKDCAFIFNQETLNCYQFTYKLLLFFILYSEYWL